MTALMADNLACSIGRRVIVSGIDLDVQPDTMTALVGVLVAVSGGIGFVGLVIPHLCRMVVGSLHRRLLPLAASVGGLFLLWVDVISRVIVAPTEMPLGVVTGLIGAPVFLIVMGRRNYGFGGSS